MRYTKEWRCTRPALYQCDCDARTDPSARQGHYITADTEAEARKRMNEKFPDDNGWFDVQLWKERVPVSLVAA